VTLTVCQLSACAGGSLVLVLLRVHALGVVELKWWSELMRKTPSLEEPFNHARLILKIYKEKKLDTVMKKSFPLPIFNICCG
jgi:hypothetical protein